MTASWLQRRTQALDMLEQFELAERIASDHVSHVLYVGYKLSYHRRFDLGTEHILPERAPERRTT